MRLTDDRYAAERSQFELALRMIRHEARTRTIRECTGLSDDRIRKLYSTYFRDTGSTDIRRRRGKSPRQITRFVKNPENQLQATTLVVLFCSGLLLRIDSDNNLAPCWPRPDVEFGHRLGVGFDGREQHKPLAVGGDVVHTPAAGDFEVALASGRGGAQEHRAGEEKDA